MNADPISSYLLQVIEYTGELVRPPVADRREHFIYNSLVVSYVTKPLLCSLQLMLYYACMHFMLVLTNHIRNRFQIVQITSEIDFKLFMVVTRLYVILFKPNCTFGLHSIGSQCAMSSLDFSVLLLE